MAAFPLFGAGTRPSARGSDGEVRDGLDRKRAARTRQNPSEDMEAGAEPKLLDGLPPPRHHHLHHLQQHQHQRKRKLWDVSAASCLREEDEGEDYMMAAEEELTHFPLCPRQWGGATSRTSTGFISDPQTRITGLGHADGGRHAPKRRNRKIPKTLFRCKKRLK